MSLAQESCKRSSFRHGKLAYWGAYGADLFIFMEATLLDNDGHLSSPPRTPHHSTEGPPSFILALRFKDPEKGPSFDPILW